jgi:hypothetical protein
VLLLLAILSARRLSGQGFIKTQSYKRPSQSQQQSLAEQTLFKKLSSVAIITHESPRVSLTADVINEILIIDMTTDETVNNSPSSTFSPHFSAPGFSWWSRRRPAGEEAIRTRSNEGILLNC